MQQKKGKFREHVAAGARAIIPRQVVRMIDRIAAFADPYATKSYAQEGEDLILLRLLDRQAKGFYVDVGAHHPQRFSNTYLFWKLGWHGINIDPNPDSILLFNRARPSDLNLLVGVSDEPGEMEYYRFTDPALNTFDKKIAEERKKLPNYRLIDVVSVRVERLDDLLSQHLEEEQRIDFLSVDAEGLDMQVLRSNNWRHYRPRFVLAECIGVPLDGISRQPLCLFMGEMGYDLAAKTLNTLIFRDREMRC